MAIPTSRIRIHPPAESGFTLAEILIGAALVAIAVAGAATLLVSGTRLRARTEAADRHEALIDNDIALVQNLARRYNWCLGAADFSGANCNSVGPGREDYYFPENPAANPAIVTTFVNACSTTAGTSTLITSLLNQLPQTQLDATPGAQLDREAAVADGDPGAQRIRITYQANTVTRVVTLVPPVANWCP